MHQIDEKDLQAFFSKPKKKISGLFVEIAKYFGFFALIFIVCYVAINFTAIYSIVRYWYDSEVKIAENTGTTYKPETISISNSKSTVSKSAIPNIDNNHILIPKINSNAPITWAVKNEEQAVQKALENGVAHLDGTSIPGTTGNVFITGHSSNYFWAKGSYKQIFALLNKLVVGDLIYVKYNNKVYVYRTQSIKVVKPSDLSVLQSDTGSFISLMTCSPVGTSINRLIVRAEQIEPNPNLNAQNSNAGLTSMPTGSR